MESLSTSSESPVDPPDVRRNVIALVLDAAGFLGGLALFDAVAITPVLLSRLGAPEVVIGMARFIQVLGMTLPALIAAHAIHARAYHKRYLIGASLLGRVAALTLVPVLWYANHLSHTFVIVWLIGSLTVFWMMDGLCGVSWFDIIGKTVPERIRGRFFGVMQALSGLAGVCAGGIVYWVLGSSGPGYPRSFAWLALGWSAFSSLAIVALVAIREPPSKGHDDADAKGFVEYIRLSMPLLRSNAKLRALLASRVLVDGATVAMPFYAIYAERKLGAPPAMLGAYAAALGTGRVVAGPVFGWVGDRFRPEVAFRLACLAAVCAPLMALAAGLHPAALFVTFFCVGAAQDGIWTTYANVMLGTVAHNQRALAIGVSTMFQMPGALYGVIGGILAGQIGYEAAFLVALGLGVIGLCCSTRLASIPQAL